MTADDNMEITLTKEAGDVLALMEGIKKWRVQPTMVRGAKQVSESYNLKKELAMKWKQVKKNTNKAPAKASKTKSKKIVPELKAPQEHTAEEIRRTEDKRLVIQTLLQDLYELDLSLFPQHLVFHAGGGACRMKFPGASRFKWKDVLENSGHAMEAMHLSNIDGDRWIKMGDVDLGYILQRFVR